MDYIPVIDFSNISTTEGEILQQVKNALANVGFLYIVNHGVDVSKVQNAFIQSKLFFEQPDSVKRQFLQNPPVTGYVGWVEAGQELHSLQPLIHGDGYKETEFQKPIRALMNECHPLLNNLFRILAKSLDLADEDFFVNAVRCIDNPDVSCLTTFRSTYYPPIPDTISGDATRCVEHADYGLITLLFQDDMGGLEVKTVDGNWIPEPLILNVY